MKIGDRLTVILYDWKDGAYKDQFGIPHRGIVVREAVEIEVFATRKSKGQYRPDEEHDGFQARSADGRIFECQWDHFDDISTNPYGNWTLKDFGEDYDRYLWHELTHMMRYRVLVTDDGQVFVHHSIKHCDEHRVWSYRDERCYMCEFLEKKDAKERSQQAQA